MVNVIRQLKPVQQVFSSTVALIKSVVTLFLSCVVYMYDSFQKGNLLKTTHRFMWLMKDVFYQNVFFVEQKFQIACYKVLNVLEKQ